MNMVPDWLMRAAFTLTEVTQGLPKTTAGPSDLQRILNLVFVGAGALAVLAVTISGIKFIISQGNPQQTATARNGIIFSVSGLVIIIMAAVIVNFVIARLG